VENCNLRGTDGDGVYEGTLSLLPGSYEYKFTYDNWTGQESLDATLDAGKIKSTTGYAFKSMFEHAKELAGGIAQERKDSSWLRLPKSVTNKCFNILAKSHCCHLPPYIF